MFLKPRSRSRPPLERMHRCLHSGIASGARPCRRVRRFSGALPQLRRCLGVALVESMLVAGATCIALAAIAPLWLETSANLRVRRAADQLEEGLHRARMEAIARNARVSFVPDAHGGWTVVLPALGDRGNVTIAARTVPASEAGTTLIRATPGEITFSGTGRPLAPARFHALVGASGAACQSDSGRLRCLAVAVNAAGAIRACDPAVLTGHPEACS